MKSLSLRGHKLPRVTQLVRDKATINPLRSQSQMPGMMGMGTGEAGALQPRATVPDTSSPPRHPHLPASLQAASRTWTPPVPIPPSHRHFSCCLWRDSMPASALGIKGRTSFPRQGGPGSLGNSLDLKCQAQSLKQAHQ